MSGEDSAHEESTYSFVGKILELEESKITEGLRLAAVPLWLPTELFDAMQQRQDEKDEPVLEQLDLYFSFVSKLWDVGAQAGSPAYVIDSPVRRAILTNWIQDDKQVALREFKAAHRRALTYWAEHPDTNSFAQQKNHLYHQFFVDEDQAIIELINTFREYAARRLFAAMERLLDMADEALALLSIVHPSDHRSPPRLRQLITYFRIRLAQLQGRWSEVDKDLRTLRYDSLLAPELLPFVARALGDALAHRNAYVEAIAQYEAALRCFNDVQKLTLIRAIYRVEVAKTYLDLGGAYTGFAASLQSPPVYRPDKAHTWQPIVDLGLFILSLPLVIYLISAMGMYVWRISLGPVLFKMDWLVARLYASAFKYLKRAHKLIETATEKEHQNVPARIGDIRFDIAQRLAKIYLTLNDGEAADAVLAPLDKRDLLRRYGVYRWGLVRALRGAAMRRRGNSEQAVSLYEQALPILETYRDHYQADRTREALAEAYYTLGRLEDAQSLFIQCIESYTEHGNNVAATSAAERMEELAGDEPVPRSVYETITELLPVRQYTVAFRNPYSKIVQIILFALLNVVLFLIPVALVNPNLGYEFEQIVSIAIEPDLQGGDGEQDREVSEIDPGSGLEFQEIKIVRKTATETASEVWRAVLSWWGVTFASALIVVYLLLALAAGYLLVSIPPLDWIGRQARMAQIKLDHEKLEKEQRTILLDEIRSVVSSSLTIWSWALPNFTSLTVRTDSSWITIDGSTQRYAQICQRIINGASPKARIDRSHLDLFRNRLFWLLPTTAVIFILLVIGLQRDAELLGQIVVLPYRLIDLLPYYLIGVFIAPVVLFVARPMRLFIFQNPYSAWPAILFIIGIVLFAVQYVNHFRPLITTVDIYVPLLTICLLIFPLIFFWRAKDAGSFVHSVVWRAGSTLVTLVIVAIMGIVMGRGVVAYHHLIHALHLHGMLAEISTQGSVDQVDRIAEMDRIGEEAGIAYKRARIASEYMPIEFLPDYTSVPTATVSLLRSMESLPWSVAIREEAALTAQLSLAKRDIQLLDSAIDQMPGHAPSYLWRGLFYQIENKVEQAIQNYEHALAIEASEPLTDEQRGYTHFLLGWAYRSLNSSNDLETAIEHFEAARRIRGETADVFLGLGYVYYEQKEYDEALKYARKADSQEPPRAGNDADPIVDYNARMLAGSSYWRLGNVSDERDERCKHYQASIEQFSKATAVEGGAILVPNDKLALVHRTQGVLYWLLQSQRCQTDRVAALESAVSSFTRAIELVPTNDDFIQMKADYIHMRARMGTALWVVNVGERRSMPPGDWLRPILEDLEDAISLVPNDTVTANRDYRPNAFKSYVLGLASADYCVALKVDDFARATKLLELGADLSGCLQSLAQELCSAETALGSLHQTAVGIGVQDILFGYGEISTQKAQYLAFTRGNIRKQDLYIVDFATGRTIPIMEDPTCDASEPNFSPDGRTLIYQSDCGHVGKYALYTRQLDDLEHGSPAPIVVDWDGYEAREASYSINGERMVFRRAAKGDERNVNGEIWVMNDDGSNPISLGIAGRTPSFLPDPGNPDGSKLVYMYYSSSESQPDWNVYLYDFDQKESRPISTNCPGGCRFPAWSPNGQSIIYSSVTSRSLWRVSLPDGVPEEWISGWRPSWSETGLVAYNLPDGGVFVADATAENPTPKLLDACGYAPRWSK